MVIFDPIYGEFVLPPHLGELMLTPEVRRLSQIRLLNTLTPSLATLCELRRYSHTLGVLYLCSQNPLRGYSEEERKALEASVLLHDIGTPPFGHLLEYHLRELQAWSHEKVINAVLSGSHVPENKAHQIFGRRTIEFQPALKKSGISLDLVRSIVKNEHPLSTLLFGTLDLDNLDNIARMSFALGIKGGPELAIHLGSKLMVNREWRLTLCKRECQEAVQGWSDLRKAVYDVVAFDAPTVAAQAVLSEAIGIAIKAGELSEGNWYLTDEELIKLLLDNASTKDVISREYLGRLVMMAFCVRLIGDLKDYGLSDRLSAKAILEQVLKEEFSKQRVLGYAFIDNGTFEKKLAFFDSDLGRMWEYGHQSKSIILYGFVRSAKPLPVSRCKRAAKTLLRSLRVAADHIKDLRVGSHVRPTDEHQQSFALSTS
jgi:HD superfamily phosphohydrolase